MKSYRVKILARAKREFVIRNVWWRMNRLAAPTLLRDEFRAIRALLSRSPEAGPEHEYDGGKLRRVLLPKTGHWVYYRVDHGAEQVEILALAHGSDLPPIL